MLRIVQEVSQCLQTSHLEGNVNTLAQRLCSELGFLEYLMEFLTQRKAEFDSASNSKLFAAIFDLIELILRDNQDNFEDNLTHILQLKGFLELKDRGQIKLLYQLSRSKLHKQHYHFFLQSWLLSLKHCKTPTTYIPMGLLTLVNSFDSVEARTDCLQKIIKYLSSDVQLL